MNNLVKADMARILKRKILYVGLVLFLGNIIVQLIREFAKTDVGAKSFLDGVTGALGGIIGAVIVVIPIFMAVFASELSSKSMQCILGRGFTRDSLIITKLIDAAILVAGYFIFATLLALSFTTDESMAISSTQQTNTVIFIWLMALKCYGYIVFSAAVLFITNSTAAGVVASIAFSAMFRVIFALIEDAFDFSGWDYTFDGQIEWAYTTIQAGGGGWRVLIALLYLAAALAISIIFFRRKEFEF